MSLHLLKKSGANRKQAYADREEFTDRRASYKRQKPTSVFIIHQQEATALHAWQEEVSNDRAAHPVLLRLHVQLITDPGQ